MIATDLGTELYLTSCSATSGHVNFHSFLNLSFLFCQIEITPTCQGLCSLKEVTSKSSGMEHNKHEITKSQVWKMAQVRNIPKSLCQDGA
jgi:hypothetical protein